MPQSSFRSWWNDSRRKASGNSKESRRLRTKGWRHDPKNIGSGPRRGHHDMVPGKTKRYRRVPRKYRR